MASGHVRARLVVRVERHQSNPLTKVLVRDPEPFLFNAEVVLGARQPFWYVSSGAYAFRLGGAAGLSIINADQPIDETYTSSRKWEVNIAGTLYPAEVSLKPMYDLDMERIKA